MAISIFKTITHSAKETQKLGKRLGRVLKKGDVVVLFGDLGSGKTTMIQGIGWGLGLDKNVYINSPSFVILKQYQAKLAIYHFDLYRLRNFEELKEIGYPDLFCSNGVALVEWAEKIKKYLSEYIMIKMKYISPNERSIEVSYSKNFDKNPEKNPANFLMKKIKKRMIIGN